MRLLIRAVLLMAMLLVGLVGIGFLLDEKVHVERSTQIAATPSTMYALLNSFEHFDQWSPWVDLDPAVKIERSGPASGVGARYSWRGNAEVGAGSQEIIATTPESSVQIRLAFVGFDKPSTATFTIKPDGSGSRVTWAMDSDVGSNPINRYLGLMMDKYIGRDYEKGLARLKTLAEKPPAAGPAPAPAS